MSQLLSACPDVVIECAGQAALGELGPQILAAGIDLVPAAIGTLANDAVRQALKEACRKGGGRLLAPSGALAGLDGLSAALHVGLDEVTYRGSAPPENWEPLKVPPSDSAVVLFSGSAREACRAFPKNANVAAAVSLAGLGFDATKVELRADAALSCSRHEIIARGAFGELSTTVLGQPLVAGKRSSRLAAGSLAQTALTRSSLMRF